jgi:simple sugar transport system permease protein
MLLILGANPLTGYAALVDGAFGGTKNLANSALKAMPLLLVGAGITVAFRTGVINTESLGLSGALIVPSLLGLGAGTWLLGRINRQRFVTVTLCVLVAAGMNLIWRAFSA